MNKFLSLLLTVILSAQMSFALEPLDLSVDEEIRRNYNVNDVSLPPLPKLEDKGSKPVEMEPVLKNVPLQGNTIVLRKGKKLKVKSLSQISDRTRVGTKVAFLLTSPVYTKKFTLPANTKIYGKIIKSHTPQKFGNGGLIVIQLTSVELNGATYSLEGRVLKADYRHIFFNKIKGKRKYLASLPKSMTWGRNYKNKMYKATAKFAKKKYTMILCPFSAIFGTLGYAGNLIFAPVIAIKYKGDRVVINKDSEFVFKLTEDLGI